MDEGLFYSTGSAARELGASADTIRALCASGVIRSRLTDGGQWRVPAREIERLKREGLPPVPRPMPGDGTAASSGAIRHHVNGYQGDADADPHLLAGRSPEAVEAYKVVHKKRARVEADELDIRQAEITLRKMDVQAQIEQRLRQENERRRRAGDERRREERDAKWLNYALGLLVEETKNQYAETVREEVLAALSKIRLYEPEEVVKAVVDGVMETIPVFTCQFRENIVDAYRAAVSEMEGAMPSWDVMESDRAAVTGAAGAAINQCLCETGRQVPREELMELAVTAARDYVRQYRARQAAEQATHADMEMRERVKSDARAFSIPWGLSLEEHERAVQAIQDAVDALPPRTPEEQLKAAVDESLRPFHAAVAHRAHGQHRILATARQQQPSLHPQPPSPLRQRG